MEMLAGRCALLDEHPEHETGLCTHTGSEQVACVDTGGRWIVEVCIMTHPDSNGAEESKSK